MKAITIAFGEVFIFVFVCAAFVAIAAIVVLKGLITLFSIKTMKPNENFFLINFQNPILSCAYTNILRKYQKFWFVFYHKNLDFAGSKVN